MSGDPLVCDECDNTATFLVFAAYPTDSTKVHPELARYPGAQARVCARHLAFVLDRDYRLPGSTQGWFVRRHEPARGGFLHYG